MPFIGNTPQTQSFAPAVDYFSGNGVTVTFTLSRPVVSVAQLTVAVDNVIQNPSSAFTVSGNSITFTSAPLSGTNNIWVEYTSLITTYAAISQDPSVIGDITATGGFLAEGDFGNSYIDGTIVDYVTGNARITTGPIDDMTFYHGGTSGRSEMMELYYAGGAKVFGTTALTIPVGTTAERPGTPANGMIRYNTTLNQFETYQNSAWTQYATVYSLEYLVVAGGGGGGGGQSGEGSAGGGGAGGYLTSSFNAVSTTPYSITVGSGGAGSTNDNGSNGSNSSAFSVTSIGGGGGSQGNASGAQGPGSGGSGGGGGFSGTTSGSGTSGQGNAGGNPGGGGNAGGGGGAGAAGSGGSGSGGNGGNGGVGLQWLNGTFYAGGGGGGQWNTNPTFGIGGNGGGGNGGDKNNSTVATSGAANTGGGGGGGGENPVTSSTGGNGGSGIVIIRYLGAQRGTGGTVTSAGGYTYHTFTSSGTYTA